MDEMPIMPAMKMKVLLMYAKTYDMPPEGIRTEHLRGCTLQYFFWGEHGEQLTSRYTSSKDEAAGFQRAKCSADFDVREKIQRVPGVYEGSFQMQTGSDGKPVLKMVDVDYVGDVNFQAVDPNTGEIFGESLNMDSYRKEPAANNAAKEKAAK